MSLCVPMKKLKSLMSRLYGHTPNAEGCLPFSIQPLRQAFLYGTVTKDRSFSGANAAFQPDCTMGIRRVAIVNVEDTQKAENAIPCCCREAAGDCTRSIGTAGTAKARKAGRIFGRRAHNCPAVLPFVQGKISLANTDVVRDVGSTNLKIALV